jgi:nitroreductase
MELSKSIRERKSIRKFKSDPVPQAILQEILEAALWAPSSINTQPWECWVVGGETLRKVAQALYEEGAKEAPPRPDFKRTEIWKEPYLRRMRENGKRLWGLLGFDRQDKEQRKAFALSMLKFFDAPQAIFLCLDSELGDLSLFDCGCFVQNICLLATEKGLGTCIQQSAVLYPDMIRRYVAIPQEKKIVVAIAIGHPDEEAILNQFRSNREPLEEFVHWQDIP